MTKRQIRALTNVVAMYIDEESRHYLESDKPKENIFKELMVLADYLHRRETKKMRPVPKGQLPLPNSPA